MESMASHWIYNLTGDVIDIGSDDTENQEETEFEYGIENSSSIGKRKIYFSFRLLIQKRFTDFFI